jgi:hypothetical protein
MYAAIGPGLVPQIPLAIFLEKVWLMWPGGWSYQCEVDEGRTFRRRYN